MNYISYKSYNGFFFNDSALKRLFFITLTSFICVFTSFVFFKNIPEFCCDVFQYIHLAQSFDTNGFFYNHSGSDIRNYFYPYFLSLFASDYIYSISDFLFLIKQNLLALVFVSSFIFNFSMQKATGKQILPTVITIALFLNPLLASIYTLPLTELYVFPLVLVIFSLMLIVLSGKEGKVNVYLVISCFLLSVLVLLRPANIILIPAFILLFSFALYNKQCGFKTILLSFFAFFTLFVPQLIFNYRVFNEFSFLPVGGLGGKQFIWGLMYLKYGTLFVNDIASGLKYNSWLSPEIINEYVESGLLYYIYEFPSSLLLLFAHVFNSLNYDFLYTYLNDNQYSIISWHQILSSLFTVFGFTYVYLILKSVFNCTDLKTKIMDFDVMLSIILFLYLGMNAFVAVETRFGMIPHMIFTIFTFKLFFNERISLYSFGIKKYLLIVIGYLLLSMYFSYYFSAKVSGLEIGFF